MLHHLNDNLSHAASRLRIPNPENYKEDLSLVHDGVLDWDSFLSGYQYHNHPVEAVLTDKNGKLKAIRRTHNLRTNVGGVDQANAMSGVDGPVAQYIGLAVSPITPNDQDQWLGGFGASLNVETTNTSLYRQKAAFTLSPIVGTTGSTSQGTYTLAGSWTSITTVAIIYGCAVFTGLSIGQPGSDMWFEAALGATVTVGVGDNLTLNYIVNF